MQPGSAFLATVSSRIPPVGALLRRLQGEATVFTEIGAAISHRPRVAPQAYAVRLYFPLAQVALESYLQVKSVALPRDYLSILCCLNGAHIFKLSLLGVPPSLAQDPPLLNRAIVQPFDIAQAQQEARRRFSLSEREVIIGYGPYSESEHVHYVMSATGAVRGAVQSDHSLWAWPDFISFLEEELLRAEAMYPEHEAFMQSIRGAAGGVA